MSDPGKPLSPAELTALEHAFAADPASQAYRPLTEAYLSMSRFMEAMVVCKKGVKAHPGDAAARLLLARVYAEQGKDRKALEEVQATLQDHPNDPAANRMAGVLRFRLGEKEPGAAALRKAAEIDPNDPETVEALKQWGVSVAPPPPPRPIRPTGEPVPVVPRAAGQVPAGAGAMPPPIPAAPRAAPPSAAPPAPAAAPPPPAPAQPAPSARNLAYSQELADRYGTEEHRLPTGKTGEIPIRRERSGPRLLTSILLVVVLAGALGGWYAWSALRRARTVEIDKLIKQTRELIEKDSYSGYKLAAQLAERILEKDGDSVAGHAFLAYVDVLRWGEHGEGEGLREEAKKHLEAGRQQRDRHSHLIAADAYLKFFGGDAKGAIQELEGVLKGPEGGTSGLLYGVLGVVQMHSGDLDGARESLTTARKFADRDVRVNQMLAEQYRRRGAGFELQAITFYESALRLSSDHVPSLLGVSLMLISREQYDEALRNVQKVLDVGDATVSPRQLALARAAKAHILYAKGKASEGAEEERKALALDPANPDVYAQIGRRKLAGGDVAGAVESFQKAIQSDPRRFSFYADLAGAMMRQEGGARQAVAALLAAQDRLPGNARVVKLLGDAYRADGNQAKAVESYEKALGLEKRYPDARLALARVYRDRREYPKALEELQKAVREYAEGATGGAAQAYVEMAEIEAARGAKTSDVEGLYVKAIGTDPANCAALWYLGSERAAQKPEDPKRRELARQMLSDYARLCPRGPHAAEASRLAAGLK
jgi:tetratricopeptide (TPR) repeat protein